MQQTQSGNNTFSYEPKQNLRVEVGDAHQTDFKPQVKFLKWNNEVNFSARLQLLS